MAWTLIEIWVAVGLCLTVAGIVIVYNRERRREAFRLREYGVPTTAAVLSVSADEAGYPASVLFHTSTGETWVRTVWLSTMPEPGTRVDVTYDPQQPDLVVETGSPMTRGRTLGRALLIVVAVLAAAVILLCGVAMTVDTIKPA